MKKGTISRGSHSGGSHSRGTRGGVRPVRAAQNQPLRAGEGLPPYLRNRVVLVTGGGAGIGAAISLALGRVGASVMVNYRSSRAPAESVAREILALGSKAAIIRADVSSESGAAGAVAATVAEFGRLDILVNNVGDFLYKPLLNVTPHEWKDTIQNNLDSAFHCSTHAVPHMKKHKWGRIVNLGVAGCDNARAFPNTTAYNIAKTGVLILAKSLAREVASVGITVNVVAPGLIDTGAMTRRMIKKFEAALPMRRAGTPDEVAGVVLFLASEAASYITGACITVSGGWLV